MPTHKELREMLQIESRIPKISTLSKEEITEKLQMERVPRISEFPLFEKLRKAKKGRHAEENEVEITGGRDEPKR